MPVYRRILLAVDLAPESLLIGRRAQELAAALNAPLAIIHVVESVPALAPIPPDPIGPSLVSTDAEFLRNAQGQLVQLARELGVEAGSVESVVGETRREIIRAAARHNADLIVLGSHQRHGFRFFIRPTEDELVHHAPCDVLAVRL